MFTQITNIPDTLNYQAIIVQLESLIRHVRIFAVGNPNFNYINFILSESFIKELKEFRLKFITNRLEIDENCFLGIIRYAAEHKEVDD